MHQIVHNLSMKRQNMQIVHISTFALKIVSRISCDKHLGLFILFWGLLFSSEAIQLRPMLHSSSTLCHAILNF